MKPANFISRRMQRLQGAYMRFRIDVERAQVDPEYLERKQSERNVQMQRMQFYGAIPTESRTKKSRASLRSF